MNEQMEMELRFAGESKRGHYWGQRSLADTHTDSTFILYVPSIPSNVLLEKKKSQHFTMITKFLNPCLYYVILYPKRKLNVIIWIVVKENSGILKRRYFK